MIYLDNGATTPIDPAVVRLMAHHLAETFGNPSSLHRLGAASARVLSDARQTIADALTVDPGHISFTGGGTEADNIGTLGAALAAHRKRRHALIFDLEHPAVRGQAETLAREGFEVEVLPTLPSGLLDLDALAELVRPRETALVAVMHANNEIGTVQPLEEVGAILQERCPKAHFHVDAVQSLTKLAVTPRRWHADSVALAAHKLHGPKGVGALYLRPGARVRPLTVGGGQEHGIRPGTEHVASIAGFAEAVRLGISTMASDTARMRQLRDRLFAQIQATLDGVSVNGDRHQRLCNNVNINIPNARAEVLLHSLEARGVIVSSGSACHSGQTGPSHVLRAIGLTEQDTGSLRITLSRFTQEADIDHCAGALAEAVQAHP